MNQYMSHEEITKIQNTDDIDYALLDEMFDIFIREADEQSQLDVVKVDADTNEPGETDVLGWHTVVDLDYNEYTEYGYGPDSTLETASTVVEENNEEIEKWEKVIKLNQHYASLGSAYAIKRISEAEVALKTLKGE